MQLCLVPVIGVMQHTQESNPLAVPVQGTSQRGKAHLPYVLQQFALCTSTRYRQQPQNSLGWLYRNTLCIAYWVQMHGVRCLGQAISMKLIAVEMLLEPRWITSNQMLLLPFLAPHQLVMNAHNVATHLRNMAGVWSICLLVFNLSL